MFVLSIRPTDIFQLHGIKDGEIWGTSEKRGASCTVTYGCPHGEYTRGDYDCVVFSQWWSRARSASG